MDNPEKKQNTQEMKLHHLEAEALRRDGNLARYKVPESDMFQTIAQGAKDAIVFVNNRGKILHWNPACERIFGFASQEVLGKTLEIVIPERYREAYRIALKDFMEREGLHLLGYTFESEAIKKDGTEFPVEASISKIQFNDQWHAVCVARDITHWRIAQKELGETLARYQLMCNNQKDAILLVDMETQQFLEVNEAAVSIYGFTKEEFLDMRTGDVFLDEDSMLMVQPKPITAFIHKRKDGSLFPVEMSASILMWKSRETFCAVIRDVSGFESIEKKERD